MKYFCDPFRESFKPSSKKKLPKKDKILEKLRASKVTVILFFTDFLSEFFLIFFQLFYLLFHLFFHSSYSILSCLHNSNHPLCHCLFFLLTFFLINYLTELFNFLLPFPPILIYLLEFIFII